MTVASSVGTQPSPEVILVVNRRARSGESDLTAAIAALAHEGRPPTVLQIDDPASLSERLESALTPAIEGVVVAGGDGTINSAIPILLKAGKPLGIIPLGTANDLARSLNIPTDSTAAAQVIASGYTKRIDVGRVNGCYFLNAAGIGFSSDLHRDLESGIKSRFGPLAYPIGVLRRWRRHRPFSVVIRAESKVSRTRVIQVTIANGRSYGGGMTIHEDARIDDGALDVLLVLPRPLWRHALTAFGARRGVYSKRAPVVAARTQHLEIATRHRKAVATDGEVSTHTPATFDVLSQALEVYVPHDSA